MKKSEKKKEKGYMKGGRIGAFALAWMVLLGGRAFGGPLQDPDPIKTCGMRGAFQEEQSFVLRREAGETKNTALEPSRQVETAFVEEPDFVRDCEAGENTKSASEPGRYVETKFLEEGGASFSSFGEEVSEGERAEPDFAWALEALENTGEALESGQVEMDLLEEGAFAQEGVFEEGEDAGILQDAPELQGFSPLQAEDPSPDEFGEGDSWGQLEASQEAQEEGGEILPVLADEEGWEISLVYYDSQVDGGQTAIDPSTPLIWHAAGSDRERVITLEIRYANTSMERSYGPGEMEIVIPDLTYLVGGGRNDSVGAHGTVIGADTQAEGTGDYLFWHTYDFPESPQTRCHIFRNKETLEAKNNFQGSIQIEYTLKACAMDTGGKWQVSACLNDSLTSNVFCLEFDSTPSEYSFTKEGKRLNSLEGLPSGDYIWAWFRFVAKNKEGTGIRFLDPQKSYCLETLPEDCLVYDLDKNPVSKGEDGKYKIFFQEEREFEEQILWGHCYVGFPKSIYGTYTFTNEAELYGAYHTLDALSGEGGEPEYLARATLPVSVADFEFVYSGDLYSLQKKITSMGVSSVPIRRNYEGVWFEMTGQWKYSSGTMKVEMGDDCLGLFYDNGEFHLLEEGQYYFTQINIPKVKDKNGADLPASKASYTLYTRREGERSFTSTAVRSRRTFTYSLEDKVVEWYLTISGLKETVMITDKNPITACVCVHDGSMTPTGELVNLSYLQVYINDVAQISPGLESYGNELTREIVSSHDLGRYGEYRYRASGAVEVNPYYSGYRLELFYQEAVNNPSLGRFDFSFTAEADQVRENNGSAVDNFCGYSLYFLLPEGYELTGDYTLTADPQGYLLSRIRRQDGSCFASREEYQEYLSQHFSLSTQENFRGTGRTLVRAIFDLSQEPLDMTGLSSFLDYIRGDALPDVSILFDGFVTYDNYLDYGIRYPVEGLILETGVNNYSQKLYPSDMSYMAHEDVGFGASDNPVANTQDVDEDGVLDEMVGYNGTIQIISDAISTHKDISVLVQSESQNYNTSYAETTPEGSYTYKLRIRNAQEQVTDVVLYDPIEQAGGEGEPFKGILTGVDTSYAREQGYRVDVYGSTLESPGPLGESTGEWTLLEEGTDYSGIKVLAYQFLNQDGSPAVLSDSANLYVLANLVAPAGAAAGTVARNQIYVTWVAVDSLGVPISEETTLTSNTVEVRMMEAQETNYFLTLEKRILKGDVNFSQGYPAFFFTVAGRDAKGREISLERVLEFFPSDEEEGGFLHKSLTLPLGAGTYRAFEGKTMRYRLSSILEVEGGSLEGEEALFTLGKSCPSGKAVFLNEKTREMGLSDTALVVNTIGE